MAVTPEVLKMLKRAFEARPVNGCAGGCGGCLAPCPLRGSLGQQVLTVKSLREVSPTFKGIIFPVSQGSGEPPIIGTSEKTCSECKKPASTCLHPETLKR